MQTEKDELWNDFKVVKSEKEKIEKALKEKDSKQEAENKRTKGSIFINKKFSWSFFFIFLTN